VHFVFYTGVPYFALHVVQAISAQAIGVSVADIVFFQIGKIEPVALA